MSLKLEDLRSFVVMVKQRGFLTGEEVPTAVLDECIAERFGVSGYVQKSIKMSLDRFGLMKPSGFGWIILAQKGIRTEERKKDIETEFDSELDNIRGGTAG